MTGLERTQKAIRMEEVDRIPTFPILLAPACQILGVKQRDYNLDPQIMASTLIEARDLIGSEEHIQFKDALAADAEVFGTLAHHFADEGHRAANGAI